MRDNLLKIEINFYVILDKYNILVRILSPEMSIITIIGLLL